MAYYLTIRFRRLGFIKRNKKNSAVGLLLWQDDFKDLMNNRGVCEFEFHILQVQGQDLPWLGHIFYLLPCS